MASVNWMRCRFVAKGGLNPRRDISFRGVYRTILYIPGKEKRRPRICYLFSVLGIVLSTRFLHISMCLVWLAILAPLARYKPRAFVSGEARGGWGSGAGSMNPSDHRHVRGWVLQLRDGQLREPLLPPPAVSFFSKRVLPVPCWVFPMKKSGVVRRMWHWETPWEDTRTPRRNKSSSSRRRSSGRSEE